MDVECPQCGDEYQRLGHHWAVSSDCDYPDVPETWREILTGIFMGDGTRHFPPSAANARLQVTNISEPFLRHLCIELGWLTTGVRLKRTSAEIREQNRKSSLPRIASLNYEVRDQYELSTRRHPWLNRFDDWYTASGKRFPHDLELTPLVLKYWYVCDGHLLWGSSGHTRPQVWIRATNEASRPALIHGLFDNLPVAPTFRHGQLMLTSDETEWFFQYVGQPVPGYRYKFATDSKAQYREMKEAFYRRNTTTNATSNHGGSTTRSDR